MFIANFGLINMLYEIHSINANAYKLCFWMLAYLLFDEKLFSTIRAEIEPAFENGTTNLNHLLENCPRLESVYDEILRLSNSPIGARTVTADAVVGGKTLFVGTKILMPYRQMHFDDAVFGSNVKEFDSKRFLNRDLTRSSSYRPFGGAATLCPGRFLARREVYMFIAMILYRFDISLATQNGVLPPFPPLDEEKPTGGMMGPAAGHDIHVNVKEVKR